MARGDLTDWEYVTTGPFLPPKRGRWVPQITAPMIDYLKYPHSVSVHRGKYVAVHHCINSRHHIVLVRHRCSIPMDEDSHDKDTGPGDPRADR